MGTEKPTTSVKFRKKIFASLNRKPESRILNFVDFHLNSRKKIFFYSLKGKYNGRKWENAKILNNNFFF